MNLRRAFPAFFLVAYGSTVGLGQTNVLTFHNNNARTGANTSEPILSPANVSSSTFGKLYNYGVDGKVDAQPLYVSALSMPGHSGVHNVVFVATENDSMYAFDADSGVTYWHASLAGAGETASDNRGCDQVTPTIGITATPVIDLSVGSHGTIFAVAMSKDSSGNYYHRVHALDITTGGEQSGSPVIVQATYPGTGANSQNGKVVFDPKQYKDRPGLLLVNGVVYTSWSSHCDAGPYTGWIIGYSATNLQQLSVVNLTPNGNDGALWNSGSGPAADANGVIYASVANGTFDTALTAQGFPSKGDYGNAFVKLQVQGNQLVPVDYWTMDNTVSESNGDVDLGSGGLMLLPTMKNSSGVTIQVGVGAGKDGYLYVFNRAYMGKFDSHANATIYQALEGALPGGVWGSPAYLNGYVYFGAVGDHVRAFELSNAYVSSAPSSLTTEKFGYPGTTPSVSAQGASNGILWTVSTSGNAILYAYNANNLATELYNSNDSGSRDQFGGGNKFVTPIIANGKVFVPTTNSVAAFGLLGPQVIPNGTYALTNQSSKLVLDDPNSSESLGEQMDQANLSGGANQRFTLVANLAGYYTIQNRSSNLYLTDNSGFTQSGTPLVQEPANGSDSQLWSLVAYGTGYEIRNKATGLVIDDRGLSPNAGTGMIMWPVNNGLNQIWTIGELSATD